MCCAYDAAKARLESGRDELVPLSSVQRRVAGDSTVKTWREYRGLTQEELAGLSHVSRSMIAAMESGRKKLAVALNVDIGNLV